MTITVLYDFLLHDVLGNLIATTVTTLTGYAVAKVKRRTPPPAPPAEDRAARR